MYKKSYRKIRLAISVLRFCSMNIAISIAIFLPFDRISWAIFLTAGVAAYLVDEIVPIEAFDDISLPVWYLDGQLYVSCFLQVILVLVVLSNAANASHEEFLISLLILSVFSGQAITVAHELIHRLDRDFDLTFGRILLSLSLSSGWEIEHIYWHHRHVATFLDPLTARRGESIYIYIPRTILGSIINAYHLEKERLEKLGRRNALLLNGFVRAQFFNLIAFLIYIYFLGLWNGTASCLFVALVGRSLHQVTSYIEHYGLARIPGTPIGARHSWDSYRAFECGFIINIPLHSSHHLSSARRYYQLEPLRSEAPLLPYGYIVLLFCVLIPPLWFRLISRALDDWDKRLASEDELRYLQDQSFRV